MSDSQRSGGEDTDYDSGFDSGEIDFLQSRATYQSLVNTLPLSLLIKDVQGRRLFANRTYLEQRGTTLEELFGKRDEDLFPEEIARQYTADDEYVVRTGESLHSVEESVDREGNQRWIERFKSPILDPRGRVIGTQLLFWDVTDRISAERELTHERDLLNTLLRHIPDSIYFKDLQSRFLRISEAMAAKFGLPTAASAIGLTDSDIFTEEHAKAAREDELKIMQTREPLVDRVEKETWPDHHDTWCMSTKMPLVDDNNEVVGTFGISRDITELIKSQNALLEARDAADRANRAKSEFLANMSHEIRTPMNAIIGMSELLAQTKLTEEQSDYVELVRDSADSLLRLLNDILDFSKIEARKLELEAIPFSLRDLVEKTGRTLSMRAAERRLELACHVATDVPNRLIGDPGRLRQVLINLIGNAIKFTDEGEVVVDVALGERLADAPEGSVPLRFSVRDTGIGIPADKQASVLEAFTQADASTTRRFGGTGLGLAISKQLVELMHGKLALQSEEGRGTTFYFTAHFCEASDQQLDSNPELTQLGGLPVLVVDDNSTNRRILKEILTAWDFTPTLAVDGPSALKQFEHFAELGDPFPLVILDCMMPDMDGFEVAERIRQQCTAEQTKLIILSSTTQSDDAKRCQQIGIARYMTKPVVQSELLDTVLQVMGMRCEGSEQVAEAMPVCPPLRVLVAEDGIANQHVAVGLLHAAGHQAVVASDGQETISRWAKEPFDVILMDMHMPVMDGLEATRQIRQQEQGSGDHIPIIALTAAAMKEDAEACRAAGMDAYLAKPIQPRKLQEMLASFAPEHPTLGSSPATPGSTVRERGKSFIDASGGSKPRRSERIAQAAPVKEDTIDFQSVARRVPGGLKGIRRLAEVFMPECESLMQTLRDEIPGGDPKLVQRAAHTLKGSANLFHAQQVQEIASQIERIAQRERLSKCVPLLKELEQDTEVMLQSLRTFLEVSSEA